MIAVALSSMDRKAQLTSAEGDVIPYSRDGGG